jgi:hypothetical protein
MRSAPNPVAPCSSRRARFFCRREPSTLHLKASDGRFAVVVADDAAASAAVIDR